MAESDSTPYGVVYLITNNVNVKRYVGQTTKTISHRFKQHTSLKGACRAIESAIKKHGVENFTIEVLATAENQQELNEAETRLIGELGTISPNGYNLLSGGGQTGSVHEETKKIQRDKALTPERMAVFNAMRQRPDVLEKQRQNGIRLAAVNIPKMKAGMTPESQKKKSVSLKVHWSNPENIEKLKESKIGVFERHPDLRQRISEWGKAAWADPEKRRLRGEGLSKALLGHKKKIDYSPEAKAYRKEIALKRYADPEYAAMMKAAQADPEVVNRRGIEIEKGWAARRKLNSEKNGVPLGSKGCYWYKGKTENSGKWQVQIRKNGKILNFGSFANLEDAEKAYKEAIRSL